MESNGFLSRDNSRGETEGFWSRPLPQNQSSLPHLLPDTSPSNNSWSRTILPLNPVINPSRDASHRQTLDLEAEFSRLGVSDRLQNLSYGGFNGDIGHGSASKYSINDYGPGLYPRILVPNSNQELYTNFSILPGSNPNGPLRNYGSNFYGSTYGFPNGSVNLSNDDMYNGNSHLFPESTNGVQQENFSRTITTLARSQSGCWLLEQTLPQLTNQDFTMVFLGLMNHLAELMVDYVGNALFQKLVELSSEEQRTQILSMVTRNVFQFIAICLNTHGSHAVQKLLEHLTTQQQVSIAMAALRWGALSLIKNMHGHHVIKYCLHRFSHEDNMHILDEVANNCLSIATDKIGCCVLQECVRLSRGAVRDRLVGEIIVNAVFLAQDRYGNYVVQHLLGLKSPKITMNLLRQLEGHYVSISCNKFGSNVVEKCLTETEEVQSREIVKELLRSPHMPKLLVDPYGNYVVQSAVKVSKGVVFNALLSVVCSHTQMMYTNPYGKKLLDCVLRRKWERK